METYRDTGCQAQAPVVNEERSLRGFVSRSVDASG
jgi:hypothetical protein